ncbi:MAG: protein phosphatase 2C domain-containing protein [Schleiferiaceae bacterium]|nr:protein phosphatase 2C domain-containing protein [Schleiferiaceae bacterium]
MEILRPIYYSGIGQRKKNEDFLYPENPGKKNNLYMVCDGLGGMAYGELASKMTALAVRQYMSSVETVEAESIKDSIHFANNLIRHFIDEHPKTEGMSSTVAMLVQDKKDFFAAWVGDSRVYHIRDGEIMFKTRDHSYKEWLIERGFEENTEDIGHIITQAVGGKKKVIPGLEKINDVQHGDYLVLLTDGVMEAVSENDFLAFFETKKNSEDILQEIVKLCSENSKDNHTLYILKIK